MHKGYKSGLEFNDKDRRDQLKHFFTSKYSIRVTSAAIVFEEKSFQLPTQPPLKKGYYVTRKLIFLFRNFSFSFPPSTTCVIHSFDHCGEQKERFIQLPKVCQKLITSFLDYLANLPCISSVLASNSKFEVLILEVQAFIDLMGPPWMSLDLLESPGTPSSFLGPPEAF